MPRKRGVKKRNIVLRIDTYERLQKYLVELIQRRGDPRITFNEAISALLDEHEKWKEERKDEIDDERYGDKKS